MEQEETNELTGKEAYEARKAEKKQTQTSSNTPQRAGGALKVWGTVLLVVVVIVGGLSFLVWRQLPKEADLSEEVSVSSRQHVDEGSNVDYSTNPPVGGPHYPITARAGFYAPGTQPADEYIIHNLEHGDVWVTYNPRIGEDVYRELRTFADGKVVVSARDENETDIGLSAWGRIDTFNLENGVIPEQRIRDFIARYKNKGPERIPTPSLTGVGNPQ